MHYFNRKHFLVCIHYFGHKLSVGNFALFRLRLESFFTAKYFPVRSYCWEVVHLPLARKMRRWNVDKDLDLIQRMFTIEGIYVLVNWCMAAMEGCPRTTPPADPLQASTKQSSALLCSFSNNMSSLHSWQSQRVFVLFVESMSKYSFMSKQNELYDLL